MLKPLLTIPCWVVALILFSIAPVAAQFSISATVRPRTEFRNGFKTLLANESQPAFFVEQRTRLNVDYAVDKLKLGIALQDVRIWGSTPQSSKADGLTSVYEAWGEIAFSRRLSLKIGRQELDYDDARILGNLDWASQGRSHDAMKLIIQDSTWAFHAGVAFNQDNRTPEPAKLASTFYDPTLNNYKHLHYLWFRKNWKQVDISLLGLNNGRQTPDSTVRFTQTFGGNAAYRWRLLRLDGTFYYQTGRDVGNAPVRAYLTSLALTYAPTSRLSFTVGNDHLSGSGPNSTVNRSFDPLYGTHHKFYGVMDYFYVGNPHRQPGSERNVGLMDWYAKSAIKPTEKLTLNLHVHGFASPVAIQNQSDSRTMNAYLGTELDGFFTYNYRSQINLQGGYSQMLATPTMAVIKGGNSQQFTNWVWLMLTIRPVLFTKAATNGD